MISDCILTSVFCDEVLELRSRSYMAISELLQLEVAPGGLSFYIRCEILGNISLPSSNAFHLLLLSNLPKILVNNLSNLFKLSLRIDLKILLRLFFGIWITGYHWHWFPVEDHVSWRSDSPVATLVGCLCSTIHISGQQDNTTFFVK